MEAVDVWATRVRSSTLTLDEDGIGLRQADHISDLLRPLPGVDVGGAHSLNQRVTLRSFNDKDLRISVDGANQNTNMYHHMGNLQIHADILEAVDIEVGSHSVIDGGLGGAVRFYTRSAAQLLEPGARFGARVNLSHADNDAQGAALSLYGLAGEGGDWLLYHNRVERGDFRVGGGEILDQNGEVIPGTDGRVRGHAGVLEDTLLKFGWTFGDGHSVHVGHERYRDEGDYSYRPDMGLATDIAIAESLNIPLTYPTRFGRDTVTVNYRYRGEALELYATVYGNESELWRDERALASWRPPLATINEGEARNEGVNLLAEQRLGRHTLAWGLDVIDMTTAYRVDGERSSGESARDAAVFIQDRIALGSRFTLTPGLRLNRYDLDGATVAADYDETTWGLAAEWRPNDRWLVSLGATRLFKGPELSEVFMGAGLYDSPNPDLEAETGLNRELAVAWMQGPASAGVTLFSTVVENYVYDYAPRPGGGTWRDNVGDMTVDGFEAYVEFGGGPWTLLLTASRAENTLDAFAEYVALDGARGDRQQGDTYSAQFDWRFGSELVLQWDALHVEDLPAGLELDGATLDNAKPGYTVHNLSLRWTPSAFEDLTLTFGVDNVFDEFYASQSSRTGTSFHPVFGPLYLLDYEPGRNVKATVACRF
ncbi:MAG: ligand-gated channel [Gammaproteobacteria bacterium]|nr:MAG: ligand-gated channel [Gammaproteobacteria bacterium]